MEINVKKLRDNAVIPTRGSEYAAGYDLYAAIDETVVIGPHETQKIGTGLSFDIDETVVIGPHETQKIGTGLSFELPENTFGMIVARSGLATKEGLRPANCSGICDSDYRGEYIIALHNDSDEIRYVEPNERIAQLILMSYVPMTFSLVNELTITERGEGGFGSTGQ